MTHIPPQDEAWEKEFDTMILPLLQEANAMLIQTTAKWNTSTSSLIKGFISALIKRKEEEAQLRGISKATATEITKIQPIITKEAQIQTAKECIEIIEHVQKLTDNRPEMLEMQGKKYTEGFENAREIIPDAIKRKITNRFLP